MKLIEVVQKLVSNRASVLAMSIVALAATIVFVENWLIYPLLLGIGAWIFWNIQRLRRGITFLEQRKTAHIMYQEKILEALLRVQANAVMKCIKKQNPGYIEKRELSQLCAIIAVNYPKSLEHFDWFLGTCFGSKVHIFTGVEYVGEDDENEEFAYIYLDGKELYKTRLL